MGHRQRSPPRPVAEYSEVLVLAKVSCWDRSCLGVGEKRSHFAGLPVPANAAHQGRSCFGGMPVGLSLPRNVGGGGGG